MKAGNWEDVGQLLWIPVTHPKSLAIILKAMVKQISHELLSHWIR